MLPISVGVAPASAKIAAPLAALFPRKVLSTTLSIPDWVVRGLSIAPPFPCATFAANVLLATDTLAMSLMLTKIAPPSRFVVLPVKVLPTTVVVPVWTDNAPPFLSVARLFDSTLPEMRVGTIVYIPPP